MEYETIKHEALALGREERKALALALGESLRADLRIADKTDPKRFRDAMEGILGCLIDTPDRSPLVSHARMIVAREMTLRGYPHERIAEVLGRHRTSVVYYRRIIESMLLYPRQYPEEKTLYDKYVERLRELGL